MTIKEMTMDNNHDFNVTINHFSELVACRKLSWKA